MLSRILSVLRRKNYLVYHQPYRLNIVGLRSRQTRANKFDDEIHVFYKTDKGIWNHHVFPATTDPGTYWLGNPSNLQGTAILAQGQYVDAYQLGMHRGMYKALVQAGPVYIYRDYDRNARLDFYNGTRVRGNFGINVHRALVQGKTRSIDRFSAGCQVLADAGDYDVFMQLCENHKKRYGNSFTYTLIDYRAMRRETYKRVLFASSFAATIAFGLKFNQQKAAA